MFGHLVKLQGRLGEYLSWQSPSLACTKPLALGSNSSTQEAEAGNSGTEGHSWLHNLSKASLDYMRSGIQKPKQVK